MRSVTVVFLTFLAGLPVIAPSFGQSITEEPQARIDSLFDTLKKTSNEQTAKRVAARILHEWEHSGSASVDLLMQWSKKAMEEGKNNVAMDFLDQVVTLAPDYAEGWNRRATLHFMMKHYAKSMADISRVLQIEPRHFSALDGMATILEEYGRKEAALRTYERFLEIYPMMRPAQMEVERLSEELLGEKI